MGAQYEFQPFADGRKPPTIATNTAADCASIEIRDPGSFIVRG